MFRNLFDLQADKAKEFLTQELTAFREKLNGVLSDYVTLKDFSLRLTVSEGFLDRILLKPSTKDHENLVYRFEEFSENFEEFRRGFENLDYNEDDLKEGEERSIEDLEEQIDVISQAIAKVKTLATVAEQLRTLEGAKSKAA